MTGSSTVPCRAEAPICNAQPTTVRDISSFVTNASSATVFIDEMTRLHFWLFPNP
ncbi:MAG: hypothetical protein AAF490_32480 [Chloroflexota bacterium]